MKRFYYPGFFCSLMLMLSSVLLLNTVLAGGSCTISQMQVSCRVVSGSDSLSFTRSDAGISVKQSKSTNAKTISIGDIKVTCSEGSFVNISYEMSCSIHKSCPINSKEHDHQVPQIYLNQECTEVWEKGKPLDPAHQSYKNIGLFCKNPSKDITPTNDEVPVMTLKIDY